MIDRNSSLIDVAFAVCTALDQRGVFGVLTGGSAAAYWAPHAYQSADADFVLTLLLDPLSVETVSEAPWKRTHSDLVIIPEAVGMEARSDDSRASQKLAAAGVTLVEFNDQNEVLLLGLGAGG